MWEGPSDGAEGGQFMHGFPSPSGWRSTSYKISFPCFWATHLGQDAEGYSWAAGEGQRIGAARRQSWNQRLGESKEIQWNLNQATCQV